MKNRTGKIITSYTLLDKPNEEIQSKFKNWLLNVAEEKNTQEILLQVWESTDTTISQSTLDALSRFYAEIDEKTDKAEKPKQKKFSLSTWRTIAAIVAIVLFSSLATRYISHYVEGDIQLIEKFAANGKRMRVTLPDGTEAFINSGSVLIYPSSFTKSERLVYLNGEAHFDVKTKKDQPFIVRTSKLDVEALGTVFNVKAYSDLSTITTTLIEGRVRVDTREGKNAETVYLSENEQAVFDVNTEEMEKLTTDAMRVAGWIDGHMIFEKASLEEITHAISKKFNVLVQTSSPNIEKRKITIRFSKDDRLENMLEVLKEIGQFNYDIKGNTVYIY